MHHIGSLNTIGKMDKKVVFRGSRNTFVTWKWKVY